MKRTIFKCYAFTLYLGVCCFAMAALFGIDPLDNLVAADQPTLLERSRRGAPSPDPVAPPPKPAADPETILINFNNVNIIEYIRFVGRLANRNFVFDENDLAFNVTIISEEPATIDNIMTALVQELRIHDLLLMEEGNNLIIHRNAKVNGISTVVTEEGGVFPQTRAEIITQVFRLNTLDPDRAAAILKPLLSESALIEILKDSNGLIITDIASSVRKIDLLLKSIDAPNSGIVIGQYVSRLTPIDTLIPLAQQIMLPIALDQTLTFVPQDSTNSIFIISNPFLVERTISILQYLDEDQGATRILNLKDLRMRNLGGTEGWKQNEDKSWYYQPEISPYDEIWQAALKELGVETAPPQGGWIRDSSNNWKFVPGAAMASGMPTPKGEWKLDKNGNWVFEFAKEEGPATPEALSRGFQGAAGLPGGAEKKSQFFIYKLKYRKGDSIEPVIRQIADTIQQNEKGNEDFISSLRSVQWLEAPNSLVFSGTPDSLLKAAEIVKEIDTPLRQVFIEMLIMEATLDDTLEYGVTYGTRFGGGDNSGAQTFYSSSTPLIGALASTGLSNLGQAIGNQTPLIPDGTKIANNSGFNLGVIGQKITHCGQEFGSIGALVHALHGRDKDQVISTPKLLIEDNTPAEIFVGINTPFRTQSIANDRGSTITSNFEYRDIGTRLKVTPFIGNGDIIALEIQEELSTVIAGLITNADSASTSPGPTTRINRTTTRVHIPDGYFLIISGMMQNQETRTRHQVPCLGGVPILGAFFSDKENVDTRRNLMIFIRPVIVDTEEQAQRLTRRQQDIYLDNGCFQNSDYYETKEALDLFNIKMTLHPEDHDECECNR